EFRIGLQQQFSAYKPDNDPAPNPARYAVVLLSYANNTQVQKIFIRQGEGADYLPGSNNQGKRWSPYNLGNYDDPSLYNNGGFVAYPTQAGYFYQWGYSNSVNTPRPYPPVGTTLSPAWLSDYTNALPTLGSVCPSGYTMPTTGSAGTDMSYFPEQDSTAWGYYADGFFDRRQIVSSPTGVASSTVSYNASILANNVAYIGKLFYNSTTNASLFMPAAGYRSNSDGTLLNTGSDGYYWSSTQYDSNSAYGLTFYSSNVFTADGYFYRVTGISVRCVSE
ncbi:MAG: fibrobacter succinogenes major paralogous domain-containing protein, partial [Candidatus Azobacteroides sp.]|nr:fibrobacter succinogenes major paralogous domain-containing protein [Candidatus Azobacteroides sp.]